MKWWKIVLPLFIFLCLEGIFVFIYTILLHNEQKSLETYIKIECLRRKNSTIYEIRGGLTVFYSLHKLITISKLSDPSDLWHEFASDVTKNSNWGSLYSPRAGVC